MDNDKEMNFKDAQSGKEGDFSRESSSRARNRTVMLSPEVTGEVRARLAQDVSQPYQPAVPAARPAAADSGFTPASQLASSIPGFAPPAESRHRAEPHFTEQARHAANSVQAKGDRVIWPKESPLIGFFVSFDRNSNGQVFELRVGRLIITSEHSAGGNCLVVDDASVSPMHAIVRISAAGEIQVLDQLSEFGTRVKRFGSDEEQVLSGDKTTLDHGDVVKFGNRSFYVCLIPKRDES